jgi:hypothetical protein
MIFNSWEVFRMACPENALSGNYTSEKNQKLKALVGDYVIWQKRIEALESERDGVTARLMSFQQSAMEGAGDPQGLQEARDILKDLGEKVDAAGAKLKSLWAECWDLVVVGVDAWRAAAPEIHAAFDEEYLQKCAEAGRSLAAGMNLLEELGFGMDYVAVTLGLPGASKKFSNLPPGILEHPLKKAYSQVRMEEPLTPRDPGFSATFVFRKNSFRDFLLQTSSPAFREAFIRRQINAAIQAAGGVPRPGPAQYASQGEQNVGRNL